MYGAAVAAAHTVVTAEAVLAPNSLKPRSTWRAADGLGQTTPSRWPPVLVNVIRFGFTMHEEPRPIASEPGSLSAAAEAATTTSRAGLEPRDEHFIAVGTGGRIVPGGATTQVRTAVACISFSLGRFLLSGLTGSAWHLQTCRSMLPWGPLRLCACSARDLQRGRYKLDRGRLRHLTSQSQ